MLSSQDYSAISTSSEKNAQVTRALVTCGVIAGPLYIAVGLVQMLTRPGFDITRHSLSLLSNGDLGWIQIANFLVAGLLVIAGAAGMRRFEWQPRRNLGPIAYRSLWLRHDRGRSLRR
ncbi:MAG TPA: DUF998 domain-containing protein [Anaerolineales bacterium]|jgi:hypothetical protein|nr:DUF998 domain-containing protein [Anaerolineales bacterium]